MASDGRFVVVWKSLFYDSGLNGIYAQRYHPDTTPDGPEIAVSTGELGRGCPTVAMASDGRFVITWERVLDPAMSTIQVEVRIYDPVGVSTGPAFRVGTQGEYGQRKASVATAPDGRFVVVWEARFDVDGEVDVYGQRYDTAGGLDGTTFQVNTTTLGEQLFPEVAMVVDGRFVVVWQQDEAVGEYTDIHGQRFASDGLPQGDEFPVSTIVEEVQARPTVAMAEDGRFLVVWHNRTHDGNPGWGVFARRFDPWGVPLGPDFQVNVYTLSNQWQSGVSCTLDGRCVIVWTSILQPGDGEGSGVYAQRYDSSGQPIGMQPW